MGRLVKIILWSAAVLTVLMITAYFALPPYLKSYLTKTLAENLHREVSLKEIAVNPLKLTVTVESFEVKEREGTDTFVSFDRLFLNVDSFSIFRRAPILKEIRITKPFVRIVRHEDGSYNFSDLLPKAKDEAKTEEKSKPLEFSLNNIQIESGGFDFSDGPKKTMHKGREINVSLPFISNMAYYTDKYVTPSLSANINGNVYNVQGQTKPFADSLETILDVDIKDFNIPYYLAYVPFKMNFKLVSALLDTKTNITFIQYKDKKPSIIIKGDTALKNLAIDDQKNQRLLRLPSLKISAASLEPLASAYHLSKITLSSPELVIRRSPSGEVNLLSLIPAEKEKKDAKDAKSTKKEKGAPIALKIDEVRIEEGKLTFHDQFPAREVRFDIRALSCQAENISLDKGAKAKISLALRLDKTGVLSATGPVGIDPLSANMAIDIKTLELRKLQSYIDDKLNVSITDGSVSTAGILTVQTHEKEGLKVKYGGKLLIANFAAMDKLNDDDLLKWKSLFFKDMQIGYNPLMVRVNDIALTDFYARVIVNKDGTLNLQHLTVEPEAPGATQTPQEPPPKKEASPSAEQPVKNIQISSISIQAGTLDFTDRYIKPAFSVKMVEVGGRVSGLSSETDKTADVDLRGSVGQHVPLEITGKINPLRESLFLDLKTTFKDMDLSLVSPYSGKYAGYVIQKGKLSFELQYHIEDKKLVAQNRIFLDQFTFGDPVESPQATKLPVKLAVSLLKDRNGLINLEIPVTGRIDDPQFSVWRIVVQVLVNLLTKAATAPFALLGSAFGGGAELSYVEFDEGRYQLAEQTLKKIETLTKALQERPALKLDIEGHADLEKDREGLKRERMMHKLKAQKLNDLIKKGGPAIPVDEVRIDQSEYEKYLSEAYKAEKFPKPRTAIGLTKSLPAPEMEKLMMTHTEVSDSDLRLLASQRALTVKDQILKSGTVTADRVFIVEPKSLSAEKKEKLKDSRVDFHLK